MEGTEADPAEKSSLSPDDVSALDSGSHLRNAALVVVGLSVLSAALGLVRDLSLAGLFGASGDTDAFLVAWTVPETASPLLIDGAMMYLLVPVLVRELSRAQTVARIVKATLLPFLALMALLTAVTVLAAPLLVDLLAPGVADRPLAVRCFRVACVTLFFMGLSGYLTATLRAHRLFIRPALSVVAYNIGILATMFALQSQLGVFSAALGLAIGSTLMVLVQFRKFSQLTPLSGLRWTVSRALLLAATAFFPIALYTLGRQSQIFVERIVGSMIGPGAISYMNYASRVGQAPLLLALTAAAVAFPALAQAADSATSHADRAEHELRQVTLLILPMIAFLLVFAEPTVAMLFERGAFGAADTAITAEVLRLYSPGLVGQVLITVGTLVHFSRGGRTWIPGVAAAAVLVVTVAVDVALMDVLGVAALAVGNSVGITVGAVMVLVGLTRVIPWRPGGLVRLLLTGVPVAAVAVGLAWLVCQVLPASSAVQVIVGSVVTAVAFFLLTAAVGVRESRQLTGSVAGFARRRSVTR